jgi:hypothetical protein
MSSPMVRIASKPVVDSDDLYITGSVSASGSGVLLDNTLYPSGGFWPAGFRTRHGKQGYIVGIRNAVSAGGSAYATFHLLLDGVRAHSQPAKAYGSFPNQLGDPAQDTYLPVRIPVGQGQLVQATADNSDGSNAYDFTVRVLIEYEDI